MDRCDAEEVKGGDVGEGKNQLLSLFGYDYYLGRAKSDITQWLEYFCAGVLEAFSRAAKQMEKGSAKGSLDHTKILRTLDPKKRKVLELFQNYEIITNEQVIALFDFKPRTGAKLCQTWTQEGFLEMANPSRKKREYRLGKKYQKLIDE